MEKRPILQIGNLLPALEDELRERYAVTRLENATDSNAFLAAHGGEFVGVATSALSGVRNNFV